MPKRGFADIISVTVRVFAVIYIIIQITLFALAALTGNFNIGGLAGALTIGFGAFSLGVLIDIAISIEKRLYELKTSSVNINRTQHESDWQSRHMQQ